MARKSPPPSDTQPLNTPFAGLAGRVGTLPAQPQLSRAPTPLTQATPARAVVRYERKGHGGKEMTRVEQLGLSPKELERWLKEAKQGLGCGGSVDGNCLLLQGDQRERLPAWLGKRGVGKITVS